jgi:hemerythrin-like domain-containing protein
MNHLAMTDGATNSPEPAAASRRTALAVVAALGAAATLSACARDGDDDEDISATEDLMREHGVLRRILVIYREAAGMLRSGTAFDVAALVTAANLFRRFGEDYHERKLEEAHIFPKVKQAGGAPAALIDTLVAQHDRGREINLFVIERCHSGSIAGASVEPLARALESFSRMYEEHAAIEDTIVFQQWRKLLSNHQRDEAGEEFEAIERAQFSGDGFDLAVAMIGGIERRLGLSDLARYTAPSIA